MTKNETSMGGVAGPFPATTWAQVSRHSPDAARLLEVLCRKYWKPLYGYLRAVRNRSNDDAKDLVQAFFVWLLEGNALSKFAPERGGFRGYLKMLIKQFAWHQDEVQGRIKRGGDAKIVPLDADVPAAEKSFDAAWRDQITGAAIDRVRKTFSSTGRDPQFRVFEEYDIADSKSSYGELAQKLGLTEPQVRNALSAVREAVRQEIRAELAEVTADPAELEEEWNDLLGK